MKKSSVKKIILYSLSTVLALVVILCVHIYMAYRPTPPTINSRTMARIDIKQPITVSDVTNIKTFLAHEKGVDHYLVNPDTKIVVFTFLPIKTTANQVVNDFKTKFNLKAERFLPTTTQLASSCPVAGSSYTYKIYKFIANII